MKVLIISDSHGRDENLRKAIGQEAPIDLLIHAGDWEGEPSRILGEKTEYEIKTVAGNMDWSASLESSQLFPLGKHLVFLTHGHRYGVHYGMRGLLDAAEEYGADVVIFGHIHTPVNEELEGVLLLNPGSIAKPRQGPEKTYMVIEVDDETGEFSSIELKKLRVKGWF